MLIPTKDNIRTITDMRENALALLSFVEKEGLAYVFHRSEPKAVMLSLEEFARLAELLENYLDEQEAEELVGKPRGKGISFSKIAKKYL